MILKSVKLNKAGWLRAAVVAATCVALSAQAALPDRIARGLNKAGIRADNVSLLVQTAEGQTLLEHNPDVWMRSASVMKLLTSYAALELLGPAWSWPTEAYAGGELSNGVLQGPLVLKGYGDPSLTLERMWLLTQQLRQRGLRQIEGGLLIDQSFFVQAPQASGAGLTEPWEVIPGALLVNLQAERLFFEPNGRQVSVRAEPDLGWKFQLDLPMVDGPCTPDVEDRWWPRMDWSTNPPTAIIRGEFPSECKTRELNIGLNDTAYYVEAIFRRLWEMQGGTLNGSATFGAAAPEWPLLARIDSAPLSRAITDMNKFSNNPMARLVYLSIGRHYQLPDKSTAESADSAIRDLLAQKGLQFPELVQDTGSGLSRAEGLSVRHWVELLRSARASRYAAELTASLPIVGVDGTMKKRLKDEPGKGWGHFKTGTLRDSKSLAGYLTTARGRSLVVAVQINEADLGRRADAVLEDIVRLLFEDATVEANVTAQ